MKIFKLPDLGEGLAEAEIREWYVKEGDEVSVDQPIASMETAKAVVDVPSPYKGKIVTLHGKVNDVIPTGSPLVTFSSDEVVVTREADKGSVVGALEQSSKQWEERDVIVGAAKKSGATLKVMPAARVLANELNVDLNKVTPTGPNGLITVKDVKAHLPTRESSAAGVTLPEGAEALHGVRRVMAQAMIQSHKDIVPVTIVENADISNLPAKCDLTVKLLKAIVAAVQAEPALNAWFDGKSLQRKLFDVVNVGMAMDSTEGLFVPVIKDVAKRTDSECRAIIDQYKTSVKNRSVAASDMQGGTITLSNFGSIAGCYATPIIVPPMVAILGCGKSREAAVVREGQLQVGRLLPLSLTFDHRAVTGGEATRFLAAVIDYLQRV